MNSPRLKLTPMPTLQPSRALFRTKQIRWFKACAIVAVIALVVMMLA